MSCTGVPYHITVNVVGLPVYLTAEQVPAVIEYFEEIETSPTSKNSFIIHGVAAVPDFLDFEDDIVDAFAQDIAKHLYMWAADVCKDASDLKVKVDLEPLAPISYEYNADMLKQALEEEE